MPLLYLETTFLLTGSRMFLPVLLTFSFTNFWFPPVLLTSFPPVAEWRLSFAVYNVVEMNKAKLQEFPAKGFNVIFESLDM